MSAKSSIATVLVIQSHPVEDSRMRQANFPSSNPNAAAVETPKRRLAIATTHSAIAQRCAYRCQPCRRWLPYKVASDGEVQTSA
jgi:hypothetical protein